MKYRKVSTAVWGDAVFRGCPDVAKLVFLFLLTHPAMTSLGAMRATIEGLAAELRLGGVMTDRSLVGFRTAFHLLTRLTGTCGLPMVEHDPVAALVVLPRFIYHNLPENPNVVRSYGKIIAELPQCGLLARQVERVRAGIEQEMSEAFLKAFPAIPESLSKGFGKPFLKGLAKQGARSKEQGARNKEQTPPSPPMEQSGLSGSPDGSCSSPEPALPPSFSFCDPLPAPKPAPLPPNPKPAPPPPLSGQVQKVFAAWNTLAERHGLRRVGNEKALITKCLTRLKDREWRQNWKAAMDIIPDCPFLLGRKTDWQADMDFFLTKDGVRKILSGKYLSTKVKRNRSEVNDDDKKIF